MSMRIPGQPSPTHKKVIGLVLGIVGGAWIYQLGKAAFIGFGYIQGDEGNSLALNRRIELERKAAAGMRVPKKYKEQQEQLDREWREHSEHQHEENKEAKQ